MTGSLLPPYLRHERIARIADGGVYITDRRLLPFEEREVFCRDYRAVAAAIRNMVTQGGGPLEAALAAMIVTCRTAPDELDEAVSVLSGARPTNTTMKRELEGLMRRYHEGGGDFEDLAAAVIDRYDSLYDIMSDIGASLIPDGCGILTTCFPEHTFMLSVHKAALSGKDISVYVPETRPYLQGAHLTEPSLRAMGIRCFLITDGMPAHFMRERKIGLYMTASDLALRDRTVVNKTGTLGNAIVAAHYGIPYYAFSVSPDMERTRDDIVIEYRSGEDVKRIGGVQVAAEEAEALYPCFDIIDPELVTGIITGGGVI